MTHESLVLLFSYKVPYKIQIFFPKGRVFVSDDHNILCLILFLQLTAKAQDALDSLDYQSWPLGAQVKLGAALIRFLLESACWTMDPEGEGVVAWDDGKDAEQGGPGAEETLKPKPAFIHNIVADRKKHRQGYISLAPEVFKKVSTFWCNSHVYVYSSCTCRG